MVKQMDEEGFGNCTNTGACGDSVTFFRYVDWILTVPLMCVEFYLILQKAGAQKSLMWNLIFLSTIMLVTGYVGESGMGDAVIWGTISGLSYFFIVYILWFGSAGQLAQKAGGENHLTPIGSSSFLYRLDY